MEASETKRERRGREIQSSISLARAKPAQAKPFEKPETRARSVIVVRVL